MTTEPLLRGANGEGRAKGRGRKRGNGDGGRAPKYLYALLSYYINGKLPWKKTGEVASGYMSGVMGCMTQP